MDEQQYIEWFSINYQQKIPSVENLLFFSRSELNFSGFHLIKTDVTKK